MPIIYGIAALAVLSNFDQTGIDPLVDKQYAIVKQNDAPVAQGTAVSTAPQTTTDGQVPGWSTSFIPEKRCGQAMTLGLNIDMQGTVATGQSGAPATVAGQGTTVIVSGGAVTTTAAAPGQVTTVRSGQALPGGAYTVTGQAAPAIARAWSTSDSLRSLKGMDRKVSVKFNNATAADVLKWLSKQNINFVANTDNLPKSKVTMNVTNVPLHEALEAVADSLGGSWQVKGSTLIFRNGMFGSYAFPSGTSFFTPGKSFGNVKGFNIDPKQFKDLYNFKFDDSQMKALKGLDGKTFKWDDKAFKDMKTLDGKMFKFDESQLKALKDMKTLDGKMFKFDESQLKALKDMKTLDGKLFKWDDKAFKDMKTLDGKTFKFDEKFMKDMKGWQDKAFKFKKIDVKKFLDSLTKEQKDLQKKQGYLKASDLTEEQRKMLFDGPKGDVPKELTLMLNQDGEKVVIKN